ncbi:hypothetical protein KM800_06555 [Clostridium tyrobutyricum]|uniref:hypothetical protein n=1 Tax=Clostridium tyrobutyricum TaxID=1519 RepID=UPI001C38FE9C|nr:hypothetical protein [Clostridium tyrobutyricum]MBV4418993.1 hypothetical protein [Clostridium tyrobutyricum]
MSEILNDAIKYVEKAKYALSFIMKKNSKTNKTNINVFLVNETNIYFIVNKYNTDICKIKDYSKAVLYFQNNLQSCDIFKNITVIGELSEILLGKEFYNILKIMINRYDIVKRYIKNGLFKEYSIYKLKPEFIRLTDYIETMEEMKKII